MVVQIDTVSPEQYNVFQLYQIAPDTVRAGIAGVDYLEIPPHCVSEIHRHNESDAILFIVSGFAKAELDGRLYDLQPGMRVLIPRGVTHGFKTDQDKLQFVSVQVPPIQDMEHGRFDLEVTG
jgi:quercetin dioxygenase-like cupin family protein